MIAHSARYRREKGHAFERDCAEDWRQLGYDCITSRAGDRRHDAAGIDLLGTGHFRVQCKRYTDYAPIRAIEEVTCDHDGEVPILLTKADRGPTMAVLPWSELRKILAGRNTAWVPPPPMGDLGVHRTIMGH